MGSSRCVLYELPTGCRRLLGRPRSDGLAARERGNAALLASFFTTKRAKARPLRRTARSSRVAANMTDQIGPLARLFPGMADLIDQDRTSQTRYEAIVKAAAVAAVRASAEGSVTGRLWDDDGAELLAAAYAFNAGLSRQEAVATHVRTMEEPGAAGSGDQRQPPGGQGGRDAAGRAPQAAAPATSRPPPVDPRALPGPRLRDLDAAGAARLWALLAELRRGEVTPRGQLLRLTCRLPVELCSRLLAVLDGGPALVRAEAVRVLDAIDPQDPATPALFIPAENPGFCPF